MRLVFLTLLCIPAAAVASDAVPGPPQTRPVALVGATVHPVAGPAIEGGTVVFADGRITAIGKDVAVPPGAERVDLTGKHVYPSLFEPMGNIGLQEIGAVRATLDFDEAGSLNPNVKAWVAVNPDSELIPVTRSNGVLLSVTAPSGGLVAGQAGLIALDGWTWADMTVQAPLAMVVNWPQIGSDAKKNATALKPLDTLFDNVRAYQKARAVDPNTASDVRFDAMALVLAGTLPMLTVADDLGQIQSAVAFADRQGVKLILYGGYDSPLCANLLLARDIPVIVGGVYRVPQHRSDDYDRPYSLPADLHTAGVRYCISGAGRFGATNSRNLPYHAATAVAFGLPADEALKAITLYPAQIFGVADRVGSLEVGKHATLFITDGDPLEIPTQVLAAYVAGRSVDLTDRHKQLYQKYKTKYDQQDAAAK